MEQRIINMLLRWLWLFVVATIAAGLAAYWFGSRQPTEYEASVRLIVGPGVDGLSPDLNDLRAGAQLMQTYSELATTRPVLQAVINDVGLEISPDRLRRKITVRDDTETQILSVFVEDEDPVRSAAIANSLANTLLRLSPSGGASPSALLMDQIRTQASTIEENIETIEARIFQLEEDLQAATTAEEQQRYIDQLAQERTRLAESRSTLALLLDSLLNTPTNQVKIVEPAIVGVAVGQSLPLVVLIGSAAGLLLAVVSVLAYEFLDNSIKSTEELEEVVGAPVMGTIVMENVGADSGNKSLDVKTNPRSSSAEAYRRLSTKLPVFGGAHSLRSIVVSSLDDRAGANEIAGNLAIVLTQTGNQTLLVDANLHHPTTHFHFNSVGNHSGLTELLTGQTGSPRFMTTPDVPGLSVLPSGKLSYDSFSALASPKTGELLNELRDRVDVAIIVAPPMSFAESLFLASHADGIILVAHRGHSSRAKIEEAVSSLNSIDVRLVGTVLVIQKREILASLKRIGQAVVARAKSGLKKIGGVVAIGLSSAARVARSTITRVGKLNLRERLATAAASLRRGVGRATSFTERSSKKYYRLLSPRNWQFPGKSGLKFWTIAKNVGQTIVAQSKSGVKKVGTVVSAGLSSVGRVVSSTIDRARTSSILSRRSRTASIVSTEKQGNGEESENSSVASAQDSQGKDITVSSEEQQADAEGPQRATEATNSETEEPVAS